MKAKLIIIGILVFIFICACVVVVFSNDAVDASDTSIGDYFASDAAKNNSAGASFYKSNGSLLLLSDEDIKGIADIYFNDIEVSNHALYKLMKEKYRGGDRNNSGVKLEVNAIALKENKTIYEHLLNAERYNFNKIKWVKYTRSKEDGTPEMQVDEKTRLQYPKDSKNTSLNSLANLSQPYLQHYTIPYSLYIGLISDGLISVGDETDPESESLQFAYEMLKTTFHDMQINQYNMKSYTKVTKDVVYDRMKFSITNRVKYKDGDIVEDVYSEPVVETLEHCVHQTEVPKVIEERIDWDVKYCVKYAKLFDKQIINEYKYTEYDLNNEADDISITRSVYKDANYKKYENKQYYNIPSGLYNFRYDDEGNIRNGIYIARYSFEMKKGYEEVISYTWKDLLEQLSHEEKAYTVEDVEAGLGGEKLASDEKKYYKEYENNSENSAYVVRLTLFDLANARKSVYKNYLESGEEYSEHIGFAREWMTFSFYTLKQSIKTMSASEAGWKYFYGSSVGAEEATSTTTSAGQSAPTDLKDVDYSKLPDGKLGWPSPGHATISSCFADPSRGGNHYGLDISMPLGSTFVASADGEVIGGYMSCTDNYGKPDAVSRPYSDFCGGGAGNYVQIKVDGTDMYLVYMHMTNVTVKIGDKVKAGQAIGTCGTTGQSTGPHAHYEVRVGGNSSKFAINPLSILDIPEGSNSSKCGY